MPFSPKQLRRYMGQQQRRALKLANQEGLKSGGVVPDAVAFRALGSKSGEFLELCRSDPGYVALGPAPDPVGVDRSTPPGFVPSPQ